MMSRTVVIAALLIPVVAALAPLAQASPPDPIWVGGLFDASDQDDVVVVAVSLDGIGIGDALDVATAVLCELGAAPRPAPAAPEAREWSSLQDRAPPGC